VVVGRRPVREALAAGEPAYRLLYSDDHAREIQFLVAQASARGISTQQVGVALLNEAARGAHHQGIALELAPRAPATLTQALAAAARAGEAPLLLVLDHLQDPQNFGTLLRTAEAVGVHGVVFPAHRAAGVTPAVSKASAGALEHLAVIQTPNVAQALEECRRQGLWIAGLDVQGQYDFDELDANLPLAVVVGSEGSGLSQLVKRRCDFLLRIRTRGRVASLNASVAGSIVLYDVWRRRQHTAPAS